MAGKPRLNKLNVVTPTGIGNTNVLCIGGEQIDVT